MKTLLLSILTFLTFNTIYSQCTKPYAPLGINARMCEGSTMPSLYSSNINTLWYKDVDTTELLFEGYSYSPSNTDVSIGINTFYMVAIDDTCRSDISEITLTIYEKPIIEIGVDKSICFTDSIISYSNVFPSFSNGSNIEWSINNNTYVTGNGFKTTEAFKSTGTHKVSARFYYVIPNENILCVSDTANIQITILPCFTKSYLLYLIDSAQSLLSNASELKISKYYYPGAIDSLNNTLTIAENVYNNNLESEINTSSENLIKAITFFHSMEASISEIENSYVNIYPNPTSGIINIDVKKNNLISIKIRNYKGQIILISTEDEVLDISDLESGIYYITLLFQNYEFTKMIIKK